jgi:hypothetical protein
VVASGKVRWRGSHRRRPTAVGWRKWSDAVELRWPGRASTSPTVGGGDKGGETRSKRVGRRGCDAAHRGGGGQWHNGARTVRRRQSDRLTWTRGQGKRGGGDEVLKHALTREDERGKKRGARCGGRAAGNTTRR